MNRLLARAACATVFALVLPAAQAGVPTLAECLEGSDFIANAARARDNGIARTTFLARIEEDFLVIRAFPPALRWFVKDDDDERFLRGAAARVFDQPLAPDHHHADFLAACLERAVA